MQFFPKTPKFFDAFEKLADQIQLAGVTITQVKVGTSSVTMCAKKLRELELTADEICHQISNQVNATFIPPIDREDIQALARNLDTIIDLIENSGSLLELYRIKTSNQWFTSYCKLLKQATTTTAELVRQLRFGNKKINKMRQLSIEIHRTHFKTNFVLIGQ